MRLLLFLLLLISCQKTQGDLTPPSVLQFTLSGVKTLAIQIDASKKVILITVPYQTFLRNIVATISTDGESIVPASGSMHDFDQVVYYTLTGSNGVKVVYQVIVQTTAQPQPKVISFSKTTLEAGESLVVKGENFGQFPLDISASVVDNASKTYAVSSQWIDSTQVAITLPFGLTP